MTEANNSIDFSDLRGKRVLVIGSGADLNGRKMGEVVESDAFDLVIRCNKPYGDPVDVGTRCDVAAVRYEAWLLRYGLRASYGSIRFNEGNGLGKWQDAERDMLRREAGVNWPSCGLLACYWAVIRGAVVYAVGFGSIGGKWATEKTYTDGTVDKNQNYDWEAEHQWLQSNVNLL